MCAQELTLGVTEDSTDFRITEELLNTHLAIFGGTRFGKSKLMELICRELILNRRGFAFIDPHSDTADDLFSFICAHAADSEFIKRKVHYLRPDDRLFSFDPFIYRPDPDDPRQQTEYAYRSWLHGKVKDLAQIICRQQGHSEEEAQKMVRLRRWLYNALYAIGVRQDPAGTHLPLRDALVLLNPQHDDHPQTYDRIEPFLSDDVRADFKKLKNTKEARRQEDWVESTFNRLREILSPTLQAIFNTELPPLDIQEIIRNGDILLASLGKTPFFHQDEAMAVAGILIREISEAVRIVDREKRKQFYLFIDEAHNFLGDDLIRLLKESAKYKLSFGLAVQGLDNLQKGDIDMVPTVLGQCGIRITFRQQFHEHAEALAESFCYPILDFTPLMHEVDRDDGYDWVWTPSVSEGEGETRSLQWGVTESDSETDGESWGEAFTRSYAEGTTHSRSTSKMETWGRSSGVSEGISRQSSESVGRSQTRGNSLGESFNENEGRSEGGSQSFGSSLGESFNVSRGHSQGNSTSFGRTDSESVASSETHSDGSSQSDSIGSNRSSGVARSGREGMPGSPQNRMSISRSTSEGSNQSRSTSRSSQDAKTSSSSVGSAMHQSRSVQNSEQQSHGYGQQHSVNQSHSIQSGQHQSNGHGVQQSRSESTSQSRQRGTSEGTMRSVSSGEFESEGETLGEGISNSETHGRAESQNYGGSHAISKGVAVSKGEGRSNTRNRSITLQLTPLHKTRKELQKTGQLEISVNDQFAKQAECISALPKQECLIAIAAFNSAFVLRVADVRDPFEPLLMSPKWQQLAISKLKDELYSSLPYYFQPTDAMLLISRENQKSLPGTGEAAEEPPDAVI